MSSEASPSWRPLPAKPRIDQTVDLESQTLDICSYSSSRIRLLRDGTIWVEISGQTPYRVTNSVKLERLEVRGYLYGVCAGSLYILACSHHDRRVWTWSPCAWAPRNITHTSATLDGQYLLLQSGSVGRIYDVEDQQLEQIQLERYKRIYGTTLEEYVDVDSEARRAVFSDGSIVSATAAALGYRGEKHHHPVAREIRMVEWRPVFLAF